MSTSLATPAFAAYDARPRAPVVSRRGSRARARATSRTVDDSDSDCDAEDDRAPDGARRRVLAALAASGAALGNVSKVDVASATPLRASMRATDRAGTATPASSARAPRAPGYAAMRDANVYHGAATMDRESRGLDGLLPSRAVNDEVELARARAALGQCESAFASYKQLVSLQTTDKRTFYQLLRADTADVLPYVYTPTVGEACLRFGTLVQRPHGLWVSLNDAGSVRRLVRNWPERDVKIAVITDGERILGLGDQGANGMGISAGKSMVYAACGVPPSALLPIQLDVGTNNETLLDDPLYIGLKQKRERSEAYDALLDELIVEIRDYFGPNTIIHFEDFAPRNAFRLLRKYYSAPDVVMYNDDIQGTAAVTVSGLLASVRALKGTNNDLTRQRVLFFGAGQANIGAAELFVKALVNRGVDEAEAKRRVWLFDSKGLVVRSRASELSDAKLPFAQDAPKETNLASAIERIKPTALVGASAVPGAFTQKVVRAMTRFNDQPIIFALSNPTSKAECSAEDAYRWSDGRAIFASGTRSAPVEYSPTKTFAPGFANNAFIFPPIAIATILTGAKQVTPDMFLTAAEALADSVGDDLFRVGAVYPPVERVASSAVAVAAAVASSVDDSSTDTLDRWRELVRAYIVDNDLFDSASRL